jgi:hypothetical protein
MAQRLRLSDRARLARQDQERDLERVVRGVCVAQQLPANSEHHRPVPVDERSKRQLGRLAPASAEQLQEPSVRQRFEFPHVLRREEIRAAGFHVEHGRGPPAALALS